MSLRTLTLRNVCLSSAAAFAILSAPAFAVPTIIGNGVAVPLDRGQVQPAGKTTQIRFDDGSVISFVGAASYVITGEREIQIESGNVTVLGRSLPLTIRAGGTTIRVTGGVALTLSPTTIESHVFSGTTRVSYGRATKSYSAGQAWRAQGGSLSRILAVGPQAVTPVANLRRAGISGAALNGLPVVLGEALAALGASSDIVAAGRSFDAVQQGVFDVSAQAFPSDLNLLLGFQADLAARLGGGSAFRGGSPVIIDTYLRYLAGGGRIAEFQTAYTALITTYLELLASGGSPGDFSGLGGLDIQAYLDYLQSVDGLGRLGDAQQSLVAEYLAFIRAGGDPSLFIANNVQLTPDVIALYQSILGDFVAFVRGGGVVTDFDGADSELIARYIRLLASAGQLDILFGAQADVLQAYADFLVAGGTPGGFDRFDEFGLSEALILDYTTTLQTYLTFLFNGGSVGGFDIDAATLAQYIVELDQADALGGDLADRRAVLLEFAAFVRAGNAANNFFGFFAAGLSEAAIAQYSTSISGLLSVYAMGGSFADYTGDLANILRIIQILEAAGQLDDEFATQRAVLLQFVSFINGGGTAADFDGFIALGFDAATVASYVASINTILNFVFDGGDLANFDGDVNAIITLINALETSGQLQGALSAQRTVLLDFVAFIEGGGALSNFDGFLALGLSDTVVQAYSTSISDFLQFLIDGGEIGEFSGDLSLILSYINDLQSAGRLSGEFSGATLDALLAYAAFIADGGAPADFTGFDDLADVGGGGGNTDTGEGYSAGPDVEIVAGIDADALADFNFRGSSGLGLFEFSAGTENSRLSPIGFDFPTRIADSRDDNGFQRGLNYDTSALELVTAQVNGDILMARHVGPGNYRFGGNLAAAAEGHFVDSVYVAGAPMTLPTTGQIIYDLDETLGVQVNGDYEGEISLDMVLGLSFGAIPRVAMNGAMTADTVYEFSSGDDAATGIDFSATTSSLSGTRFGVFGDFTSGEGAFCSAGATCSAFIQGILNADFTQIGGGFTTRSSNQDDLTTAAIVSFLARDASSAEVVIPDLVGNGTVSATPDLDFDRGILIRANGGSDNRRAYQYSVDPQASLEFDADGALSVMFRGFTNAIERGDGVVADLTGSEDWQVGRWLGLIGPDVFGQNSGYGYAVIPVLASTPANGRIEYSLLGASSPVYGNGATAPGTFDGSAVLVIGTQNMFGLDAVVTMPDATYTFGTEGGVDDPSMNLFFSQEALRGSAFGLAVDIEGTGAACPEGPSNCTGQLAVGVGGEDGQYAGVSYFIGVPNTAAFTPNLTGTAVFGGELVPDVADPLPEGTERADQFVVYASNEIGIDNRNPTTVIYDDVTGAPLYYRWELNDFTRENERPQIGTAEQHESGSVEGVMGWTRWAGGTSGGRYYNAQTVGLPENAGWHVLSGSPVTNMPTTGTVSYNLIGNTNPTIRNGTAAPGTLDSASAAVAFGTVARVGLELGLTVGGEGYSISTIGGVSDLSQGLEVGMDEGEFFGSFGGNGLQGTLNASGGSLCSGDIAGCNANVRGFLAGDGASHMGIAYTLGNTGFDNQIDGTAAFAAGDAVDEDTTPKGTERSGQVTAYAATTIGIDSRSPTTVTYDDTTGAPLAYSSGENESPQIGTAMQRESGSAGDVIGWTRWAGGRTAGRYYSNTEGVDLPENAGWHLVSGTAATNLPASGTVQYDLTGSTAPTIIDGSAAPGTLDNARAAVAFGTTPRVGLEMDLTVDGEAYNLTTIGGVSDLTQGLEIRRDSNADNVGFFGNGSQGTFVASGGSVCDGNRAGCGANMRGFLAGDGASHMGVSYSFGAASQFIQGTAAFAAATDDAAQGADIKPDYTLNNLGLPTNPLSVGTSDPLVPPVIDSTWTRWTQPSGGLLARPTAEPDRIGGPLTPQGSDVLMPSWISYDRR